MRGFSINLIQGLIQKGQKGISRKIYYSFLDKWKRKTKKKEMPQALNDYLKKVSPKFGFVSFSKGGIKYQVPQLLTGKKSTTLALKWVIHQYKKGQSLDKVLLSSLVEVKEGRGNLLKRRDDVHKLALLNQKYLRFMRVKRLTLKLTKNRNRKTNIEKFKR